MVNRMRLGIERIRISLKHELKNILCRGNIMMINKKLFRTFVLVLSSTAITACTWWLPSHFPPQSEEEQKAAVAPTKTTASAAASEKTISLKYELESISHIEVIS